MPYNIVPMNYLNLPYLYIFLLSLFYSVTASSQSVAFNHLTTQEGLSQLSVNSIYVDEFGILWIGTRVGLNIYDGQKIHTINKEKSDPNSLPSNIILQVTGNKDGKVYILSPDCVSELNIMTQRFKILKEDKIGCIYYKDKLYITIGNSILTYNDNGSFETFYTLPDNSIKAINSLILDDEGNMWIGTPSYGVFKYDTQNSTTKHIIEHGNITKMYIDQEKTLWIGSWENGLYTIKKDGEINNYKTSDIKRSISSDFVRAICQDNQGNIWIGTSNGIDKYDRTNSEFIHYSSGETDHDLTDSSVWCIEKDAQGTLWIGTYFGGVNYVNPEYSIYRRYYYSKEEGKGLSSPVIGRMTENKDGKIWIATEGGGVNLLDRTSRTIEWPKGISGPSNSLSHNNVKSLYYDEDQNTLWIGTHTGGLNKYDIKTRRITLYMHHSGVETSLPSNIIRDIEPYTSDSLIIATQNGICIMEKESGKCRHILRNLPNGKSLGMVADVTLDKNNNLWIAATGEGVYVYNMSSSNVKNYRNDTTLEGSISSNNINNIITDSKNNIWICTSGCGLDLYIPETDSFRNFDKQNNNLANDCIYQACESPVTGNLLLITTDGFSIFDKEKKIFYNYNSQNGFPIDAVNENALYIASDGEVFLGGIRNMVSFYEKDLFLKHKPYSIILTGLVVNGNYINVGDKTGILKESLNYTRQITLSHKENIFSIDFAVTNHIPENKDKIIYKLEGFSEQWNEVRNSNEITYTNLSPGSYTLIIKAQNEDTSICKPIRIDIKIKTPFYKTPIAYIIYTLSAALLLWYIISIYITRLRLSESLKLEQKHAENIKKENQAQLKLFTNISHEFRTPLTLIISQIETLIQNNRFTNQTYNKLSIAYHNCMQLRELITELLDYRKHEMGHLKLQVCHNDIIHFIRENYILFSDYASKNNITIEFNTEYESLDLWFDPKHFQKVINNLLFNAIKSTGNGGKISIEVKKDNKNAIISISDNGKGIPAKDIDKIFDIFYQVEDSNSSIPGTTGSGIGLAFVKTIIDMHHGNIKVSSKEGEGSTFSISLPLGKAHFSKSEIIFSQPTDYSPPVFNSPTPIIQSEQSENTTEIAEISSKLQSKPQMFIVEDNEQIRAMLKEILSPFYYIRSFATAESAISEIEATMPDIVITDVMMPGMDGKELCKRIKSNPATSHIPVVLLTAQNAIDQYIEGLRTGADDYITKPFNTQLLISRCNNLVNSRILLQEKFSHKPETTVQMLASNKIDKEILDKAISIIEANISNTDFNMNTFAREMGMARTNLFAKIKAISGQTPNDFIISIRLKKGAYLLRNNPELNITEIAEKIGFSSPRYFSKCFKDIYNISPLTYRKGKDEK